MHHLANLKHTFDITGSIFSLLSTLLYIKADKRAWPVSLVAILINMTLYLQTGIYGDSALELIYLISTFYGWYLWARGGKQHSELPISHITLNHAIKLIATSLISIIVTSFCLIHFTNSQVPYWDATTTVLGLIAQWLICRKIIECWILWFIVDAIYAGLYFYKGITAHSILLIIYVGLAVVGYLRWYYQINPSKTRSIKLKSA